MKNAKYLLMMFSVVFMLSCSKDMKVVKQLDGTWKVTGMTVDGQSVDPSNYEGQKVNFTKCKVKKEECDGSFTFGALSMAFTYKVTDKGTKISMTFEDPFNSGSKITQTADIDEHSKSKFVYSTTENGVKSTTTLEKE